MNVNPHIGSSFDEFLEKEGIFEEVSRIVALRGFIQKLKHIVKLIRWLATIYTVRLL